MHATALAQNRFDPSGYIQSRESQQTDQVKEGEVKIDGIKYRVFTSPAGNLFVPALDSVTKENLEQGLCANQVPAFLEKCNPKDKACQRRNQERMTTEVTVIRADTALGENTKAYAEILTRTIKQKCGEVVPVYFTPLTFEPELGIEYKDTHRRDPTTYKVYTPGWKPEVGFKSEF